MYECGFCASGTTTSRVSFRLCPVRLCCYVILVYALSVCCLPQPRIHGEIIKIIPLEYQSNHREELVFRLRVESWPAALPTNSVPAIPVTRSNIMYWIRSNYFLLLSQKPQVL